MVIMQQLPEITVAYLFTEHLASSPRLMEMILERGNMFKALARVRGNKGVPGIDKMTLDQLPGYLKRHWPKIREDLLNGRYKPSPVRRKEISKPGGGVRLLGIPTVLDRLIQQAIAQILQEIWDPTFSNSSFGFRPGKSQHKAILRSKHHLESGYGYTVDIDLSKFFDRVNHDRLMSRLAAKIKDKRVLKLIRKYLTAGIIIDGLVTPSVELPREARFLRCSQTSFWMSWTRNWRKEEFVLSDMPMTLGYTSEAEKLQNGLWIVLHAS